MSFVSRGLVLLLILLFGVKGLAQSGEILQDMQKVELIPLAESTSVLTFEDARRKTEQTNGDQIKIQGYSHSYYWFRIKLLNKTEISQWNLMTKRYIDHIIMYSWNVREVNIEQAGNSLPVEERGLRVRRHGVKLELPPESTREFIIGIQFGNPSSLHSVSLYSEKALQKHVDSENILGGIYLGIAFVLFFYNLFFYSTLKDKTYLYYEVFVVVATIAIGIAGTPFEFIMNDWFGPLAGLIRLLQILVTLTIMGFVYHFLEVSKLRKAYLVIFKSLFISKLLIVAFYNWIPIEVFGYLNYISPLAVVFLVFCTMVRVREKDRSALIYLIGLGMAATGVIIKEAYHLGAFNNDLAGAWAPIMGVALEMIFMSLAIGYRIRHRLISLFQALQESKENLEGKIQDRTAELAHRNQDLEHEISQHKNAREKIKEQQELLIQSEKMSSLGFMAAGIAHEINNPLAIISGYAENIKRSIDRGKGNPEVFRTMAVKIVLTTERITRIIRAMQIYARPGNSNTFEAVDIAEVISDSVKLCRERVVSIRGELILDLTMEQVEVRGRAELISQVVLGLLNNSIDAIKNLDRKWVKVSSRVVDERFVLRIVDAGSGIDQDTQLKIFDPFYTTKEVGEGTGLGLSVAKRIIEDHHGQLVLVPEEKNTTFEVNLPLSA